MRINIAAASLGLAACVGAASSMAANITDGTYISLSYYDSGNLPGSYQSSPGINYTNGVSSNAQDISDPSSPYASALAAANLNTDTLLIATTGSSTYATATAEMWDTLTFGGAVPTGGTVSSVAGYLNMTVTTTAGTAKYGISANSALGLQVFNTGTFAQPTAGVDCGTIGGVLGIGFSTNPCIGSILGQATTGGSIEPAGGIFGGSITNANANTVYTFSIPITSGEVMTGFSYIAEIAVSNSTDPSLTAPLIVDPSISFSSNISGLTVSSTSGINYENPPSPVPVPAAAWLFGSGVLALFWTIGRRLPPLTPHGGRLDQQPRAAPALEELEVDVFL
jgi:hypothetical protein